MGTGMRSEEEITRSGRWLVRDFEEQPGPGPIQRYANEDQWSRARRYEHQALFRMPDPESETRASDFEGYSQTCGHAVGLGAEGVIGNGGIGLERTKR